MNTVVEDDLLGPRVNWAPGDTSYLLNYAPDSDFPLGGDDLRLPLLFSSSLSFPLFFLRRNFSFCTPWASPVSCCMRPACAGTRRSSGTGGGTILPPSCHASKTSRQPPPPGVLHAATGGSQGQSPGVVFWQQSPTQDTNLQSTGPLGGPYVILLPRRARSISNRRHPRGGSVDRTFLDIRHDKL